MNKLPKGWEITRLGNLAIKIGSGITPLGGSHSYKKEGIPFIRSQNVLWGILDLSDVAYIDEVQNEKMSNSIVLRNDVLLNITGASIGRSCVVPSYIIKANVNQHVCIIRVVPDLLDSKFLKEFLLSHFGQKQIEQFQAGGNRQGLNFEQIKSFRITLPPLPEQQKIAEILSTWDKAIEVTEALISKSQLQKKALMQLLLTGKQRFPGFKGEWVLFKLLDICQPQQWPTISSNFLTKTGYKVYGANGFIGYYPEYNHLNETVTVTCRGSTCGEVSLIPPMSYITGNSMCIDGINEAICHYKFLYFLLKNRGFKDIISGSAQPQIIGSAIKKIKVKFPSLNEQQKIASFLTTGDQEIELLEKKLSYLKQEKNALMQELLTGKRRVKI
jgi:type I restriction enzyme S subunit